MKTQVLTAVSVFVAAIAFAGVDSEALQRARARLGRMTLDEKVMLTGGSGTMTLAAIPRVGIDREWTFSDNSSSVRMPLNRWTWDNEGDPASSYVTSLPTMSALASTWNPALARLHGEVLGEEARARGVDQMLGPGVNIMRTPLCGRNWEYMGEDPRLASEIASSLVHGLQSKDVAATVKHFCLNNQELNRNNVDTVCDERTLHEIYLPAFRAALVDADGLSVMTAYNKAYGQWLSENAYLQRGILRSRWHFPGMIVTDWGGAHTTVEGALSGGGVEMNRGDEIRHFVRPIEGKLPLADAVRRGDVPEAVVDEMALHVLYVMEKVGFFDEKRRAKGSRDTQEHRDAARRIGEEGIVLLKNDAGTLPLDAGRTRRILVVGRLASSEACRLGWSMEGNPPYEITPLRGLEERLGCSALRSGANALSGGASRAVIVTAPLTSGDESANAVHPVEAAMETFDENAHDAGMSVKAWHATYWKGRDLAGEAFGNGAIRRLDVDWKGEEPYPGVKAYDFSARFTTRLRAPETGRYRLSVKVSDGSGARLSVGGKTVADGWNGVREGGLSSDVELTKGALLDVAVEYRSGSPESVCRFGWIQPSESGMGVDEVRAEAEKADAVIVFTGTEIGHGQGRECEGGDRPNLKLPEGHDAAIEKILSWNIPNTVVIVRSGAPLELPWASKAQTLVQLPYLGQEAGRALANVLFGDVNPSGRLPCTWPRRFEDTGVARMGTYNDSRVVYNERFYVGYRWFDKQGIEPLFPFGYGLSYSKFEWGEPRLDGLTLKVPVTNKGGRAGSDVVQVYVAPVNPSVERPVKELRGFAKVSVAPGETSIAEIRLSPRDFAYFDELTHRFRAEAGEYRLLVGASSRDIRSEAKFTLGETVEFD